MYINIIFYLQSKCFVERMLFSLNHRFHLLFLQIKQMFTLKRTIGILLGYFAVAMVLLSIFAAAGYWYNQLLFNPAYRIFIYDNVTNRVQPFFRPGLLSLFELAADIGSPGMRWTYNTLNVLFYAATVVGTIMLVIVFKRSIKERKSLTGKDTQKHSAKEKRLIQSVLGVCAIYIFTASPAHFYSAANYLGALGRFRWYFFVGEFFAAIEAVNHSVNIFVYLLFNLRFRETFMRIFCFCGRDKSAGLKV